MTIIAVLACVVSLMSVGGEPADVDPHHRDGIELLLLAGMPRELDQRLDALAGELAAKLPPDTPKASIDEVVGKIRQRIRSDVVLAQVAADAATRFSPDEVRAAADALRDGRGAADVVGAMREKLARTLDVELARASNQVVDDVDAEVAASVKATDAAIVQWQRDIEALRQRADALTTGASDHQGSGR